MMTSVDDERDNTVAAADAAAGGGGGSVGATVPDPVVTEAAATPAPSVGNYQVGISSPRTFEGREGINIFNDIWKDQFQKLDLSLVEAETEPQNAVNYCPYTRTKKDTGTASHVVLTRAPGDTNRYFAVLDTLDQRRAFVGQYAWDSGPDGFATVVGGICYFDDDGKLEAPITALSGPVFRGGYDVYKPSHDNVLLCGEILLFGRLYSPSSGSKLSLEGWIIRNDCLNDRFGSVKIKANNNCVVNDWEFRKIKNGRWLCLEYQCYPDWRTVGVDLKSFRLQDTGVEQKDDHGFSIGSTMITLYDQVDLPHDLRKDETEIDNYFNSLDSRLPKYRQVAEHYGGYPKYCIKCDKETVSATYRLEGCGPMFVGCGVCLDCQIRYSRSGKEWMCMRYQEDDKKLHCNGIVGEDSGYTCCGSIHDDPNNFVENRVVKPVKNRSYQVDVDIQLTRKRKADDGVKDGTGRKSAIDDAKKQKDNGD